MATAGRSASSPRTPRIAPDAAGASLAGSVGSGGALALGVAVALNELATPPRPPSTARSRATQCSSARPPPGSSTRSPWASRSRSRGPTAVPPWRCRARARDDNDIGDTVSTQITGGSVTARAGDVSSPPTTRRAPTPRPTRAPFDQLLELGRSASVALAGAVVLNTLTNTVTASISGAAAVSATGAVTSRRSRGPTARIAAAERLHARDRGLDRDRQPAAGVAIARRPPGASSKNTIANSVSATIDGDSTVTAGSVEVTADDASSAAADADAAAVSSRVGLGDLGRRLARREHPGQRCRRDRRRRAGARHDGRRARRRHSLGEGRRVHVDGLGRDRGRRRRRRRAGAATVGGHTSATLGADADVRPRARSWSAADAAARAKTRTAGSSGGAIGLAVMLADATTPATTGAPSTASSAARAPSA